MPYNLLLLPLIGGFLFLHITHFFRFGAQRLDGYRLLFQSAIAGIVLSALARYFIVLADLTAAGQHFRSLWMMFSPFPYSGTSALALLIGPVMGLICNLILDKSKSKDMEIRRHGNLLLKLLNHARRERLLISVTLDSRKWYVGWVVQAPNLDPQELYFQLLPFISGYRDKDTLITHRSVFYQDVLEDSGQSKEEFLITLPLKDVKIAGLFNDEVYNEYFAEEEENSADESVTSLPASPPEDRTPDMSASSEPG